MTTYARVVAGEIASFGLPQTGTLSDGRQVSGYDRLDDRTLAAEGWLPVVEDRPKHDAERCVLAGPDYIAESARVVARYTVTPKAPEITTDVSVIRANGASAATVTYSNHSSTAPFTVTFTANGASASEKLVDGKAQVEIVASAPGPVLVQCEGLSITINTEEPST